MLGYHGQAIEDPTLTVQDEMQMKDQGIYSPYTLVSLSSEDISVICDVIRRLIGLVGRRTPDRENEISTLATKNLKLATFMFKTTK